MDEIIDDLERKIKVQRDNHSFFEQKRKNISIWIKCINIIIPGIITFIAFSDFDFLTKHFNINNFKSIIIIGLLSFILFLISIFDEIFKLTSNYQSHRLAIEQYSLLLRDIKIFKKEIDQCDHEDIVNAVENYNQRYLQISSSSITFTDKEFLQALKASQIKEIIKVEIVKNPFQNIRIMKLKYHFKKFDTESSN